MPVGGNPRASASFSLLVDFNTDGENTIEFNPGGVLTNTADRVGGNLEINHEYKIGTDITFKPHVHWFQAVSTGVVLPIVFAMRYRLQRNGYAKTATWTTITADCGSGGDDVFDFTGESDGLYCQISRFDDIIVDCGA